MPLIRPLRTKTLLLALPFSVFLLYLLFQGQQFPSVPSFVPGIYRPQSQKHDAGTAEQDHRSAYIKTASQPSATGVGQHSAAPTSALGSDQIDAVQSSYLAEGSTAKGSISEADVTSQNSSLAVNGTISTQGLNLANNSMAPTQSITQVNQPSFREAQIKFWQSFEALLESNKPGCPTLKRVGKAPAMGFHPTKEQARPKHLDMPEEDVEKMRKAHQNFVNGIHDDQLGLVYTPGSRGLVSTAGGKYLPVFVISLRMLRRSGTTLPVEVFLADQEEYEESICKEVLPSLNATCVIMSDILDRVPHSTEITKYQFKVFAMIFSSFEEIVFLDADAFPIHNLEPLFASELFKQHGLILWPDFWASSASTYYYDILQQPVPSLSERASSETGEILVSKKTHQRTLLLATYYNYYGPTHYYLLLSQGSPGEGDKETFLAAAQALNQTFYTTSEPVQAIGNLKDDRTFDGSAMVQFDPVQDHNLTQHGLWRVKDPSVATLPRPLFVHANFPKFNPATIFKPGGPARYANGTDRKSWTDGKEVIEAIGVDLEKHLWEEIKWTSCELENRFQTWHDKHDICHNATAHWNSLYEDS